MSSYRIGNGFKGSPSIQASVAGQEIIPSGYKFYKFSFQTYASCTIIVNGEEIYLIGGNIFETEPEDAEISSFKIKEPNISYSWMGAY